MAYKGVLRARIIAAAVCKIFRINMKYLVNNPRKKDVNLARGLFCLRCYDEGIHPLFTGSVLKCTRSNVVNITRHYKGYYETKNKEVVEGYDRLKEKLDDGRK